MNFYFMQTGLHSNWSVTHEPFEYPTLEAWKQRAKETGYNILVFADHYDDFTEQKFKKYKERMDELSDDEVLLVSGIDYHYQPPFGHHLACNCFLGNRLPDIKKFPRMCHERGGISWVSHYGWHVNVPAFDYIIFEDAIEIWWKYDEEPHYDLMAELPIPFLASSEPKTLEGLERDQDKTVVFCEFLSVENVLDAIVEGDVYMLGRKFI